MSNSNINRIEPIAPFRSYSKYSCRGKLTECLLGKSTETEEFTKAMEERLREIKEKKLQEEEENMKERDRLIREKHGEEMVNREMDKKKELIVDNKQLEECKKKIKVCGLCQKQLDPSDFNFGNTKNENTVVMVGNGKYKEDGRNIFDVRNQIILDLIEDLIKKNGLESVPKSLGITVDDIYDYYIKVCKVYQDYSLVDKGRSECLTNLISKESLENLKKNVETKFLYTDIECGHKFHKKCILEWIKKNKGQVTGDKVIGRSIVPTTRIGNKRPYTRIGFKNFSAPVTCPTCGEPIRQLYYFLPTYCDKIDETGEFIRRKRDTTTENKTKKNLTFADDRNEKRFYDKMSETDKFEYGGKRNRIRKTRRKNQKHKKTRKYKKK
jgi:hypothetical protein